MAYVRYTPLEKELAKILKIKNSESKVLCAHVVQALKDVLLKKGEVEITQIGRFSLGYYPMRKIYHPIYKEVITSFPFRKIFFKQSDEVRIVLNPHERYVKRPIFYNCERRKKSRQAKYQQEYEDFVKSYTRYQKLKLLENISYDDFIELERKEKSNEQL